MYYLIRKQIAPFCSPFNAASEKHNFNAWKLICMARLSVEKNKTHFLFQRIRHAPTRLRLIFLLNFREKGIFKNQPIAPFCSCFKAESETYDIVV